MTSALVLFLPLFLNFFIFLTTIRSVVVFPLPVHHSDSGGGEEGARRSRQLPLQGRRTLPRVL